MFYLSFGLFNIKKQLEGTGESKFDVKAMTIHMTAFILMGLTMFIEMLLQTIRGFTKKESNATYFVWYFMIILIFISNLLLLYIFNNLVNQQLAIADQEDL